MMVLFDNYLFVMIGPYFIEDFIRKYCQYSSFSEYFVLDGADEVAD